MAFDPELATQAYMATLKGAARAKSDAYFEGGYWLILWNFLAALAANLIVLRLGWAARLSRWARGRAGPTLAALIFAVPYLLLVTLLTSPLAIYAEFFREHAYGLSNQGFAEWGGEQLMIIAINSAIAALLWMGVHGVIRRWPTNWWVGGTALTIAVMMVTITLAPLYLEPLFNRYTPLPDGPVKTAVLKLARANGVPASNVYLVDASRQSDRISANVAGLFGTTRIALNDNLLKQDINEIRAVMAHELGHYVLNHVWKFLLSLALLIAVVFALVAKGTPWLLTRFGQRWEIEGMTDPGVLPALMIMLSAVFFVATPITNSLIRTQEQEADMFGMNAARAPDSFARIAMKLSQYRKIEPSPLEEMVFFDHPSGHTRVFTAMRWKAEHLGEPDIR
ncbi:M48 family metallopeptidase [Sandarakinorhabdus oryzae]|uniref:M48 family metallopeptidase n=1 Tax=Sandarakinorhabdus oryzae TaxID=2675220 RepID=UPI0012E19CF2|nr:M48 family metallopeptidase [Sandarakinorhabdus oryzae]